MVENTDKVPLAQWLCEKNTHIYWGHSPLHKAYIHISMLTQATDQLLW